MKLEETMQKWVVAGMDDNRIYTDPKWTRRQAIDDFMGEEARYTWQTYRVKCNIRAVKVFVTITQAPKK